MKKSDSYEELRAKLAELEELMQNLEKPDQIYTTPAGAKAWQFLNSSRSNEWYTPDYVIERVRVFLDGHIDLDPASNSFANQVVKAKEYFTITDDGLETPWLAETVFCNPPYGKTYGKSNQSVWFQKMQSEFKAGNFKKGVLLINACFGDEWFNEVLNYPICFPRRRIRFYNQEGKSNSPTKGNALVLFDKDFNAEDYEEVVWGDLHDYQIDFADFGRVAFFFEEGEFWRNKRLGLG